MQHKFFLPLVLVVAIAIGFGGGVQFQKSRAQPELITEIVNRDGHQPKGVDFSLFWDAWNLLRVNYVDKAKLDAQAMVYGAIDGMVSTLGDPYTVFLPPKESKQFAEQIQGSFGGVGIEIGIRENVLTVIAPIKDSPAARAGILAGDKILEINGTPTDGMKVEEAVSKIRGKKGTEVILTIQRAKFKDGREFKLIRDTIKIPTVAWKMLEPSTGSGQAANVAYLQVYVFNQNVDQDFEEAASEIKRSSATRVILDLRNNPGGLLDSAVNLAGYFLEPNKTVTIERFGDGRENTFSTKANGLLKNYPLIVLINKGSASASEILAGALRDHRNISIVGETSFGKGSVQEVSELSKGSSLKITIAKWFTPNGTSINENGIAPNIEVTLTEEDIKNSRDPQLDKSLELIKSL